MYRRNECRACLASMVVVLVTCAYSPSIAYAQEHDPLETLRRFPPDPAAVNAGIIQSARQTLEWKIRCGTMNQERLERDIERLNQGIEQKDSLSVKIADVKTAEQPRLAESAFATETIREHLLSQVLGRLLETRADIAGNEALMIHLEEQLYNVAPSEDEQKQFEVYQHALQTKLEMLITEVARVKRAFETNTVGQQELLKSQVKVLSLEAELAQAALDKKASDRDRAASIASPLASVRLELHELRAREKMLDLQLTELSMAAEVARERRRFQREIDQLTTRLDIRVRRHEQVSMETEEAKMLLQQICDASNDREQPSDSDKSEK
jgi:hypothetical protein